MPWRRELPASVRSLLRRCPCPEELPVPLAIPKVLAVTAFEHDQRFFAGLHGTGEWEFTITGSVQAAKHLLDTSEYAVVVCDRDIPGWEWRDLLSLLKSHAPRACFLLSSRVSDTFLWREVLRHGGYDLLPKPLNSSDANRILRRAWYYWKSNPPLA